MKVSLVEKEEINESEVFPEKSKFKPLFSQMADTGKILVVEEENIEELEKYNRSLHTMARRYIPSELKLQTRRNGPVLIARLTDKKFKPKTLTELLNKARVKVVKDLTKLGFIVSGREADVAQYLRDCQQ